MYHMVILHIVRDKIQNSDADVISRLLPAMSSYSNISVLVLSADYPDATLSND